MLSKASANATDCAVALLTHYSFDLSGYTARELVDRWLNNYPADWINLAVIEALYRGRYKAISVQQILAAWQRRGIAFYHFNYEFERLICGDNIPQRPRSNPNTKAKFSPPVSKAAVRPKDRHNGSEVVSVEAETRENGQAQRIDTDIKVLPSTSNSNAQMPHTSNQTSNDEQQTRSLDSASQLSIKQFNPTKIDTSDFYSKLKAIVQSDRYTLAEGEAKEIE